MRLLVLFCCLWLLPGVARRPPWARSAWSAEDLDALRPGRTGRRGLDLLQAIYEPARAAPRTSDPTPEAVGLVLRGEADAWVRRLPREVDEALYPRWPYERRSDRRVLSLKDNPPPPLEA